MKIMSSFFKSRTLGFYFQLGSILFSVLGIIFYGLFGVNEYAPSYDSAVFISSVLSIVLCLVSLFFEWKLLREFSFIISLYALISYVGSQANYIASIAVNIDGTKLSFTFIVPVLAFLLAFVLSIFSVFFSKKREDDAFVITSEMGDEKETIHE